MNAEINLLFRVSVIFWCDAEYRSTFTFKSVVHIKSNDTEININHLIGINEKMMIEQQFEHCHNVFNPIQSTD